MLGADARSRLDACPSIARSAAALRARHGRALRLPDALVLATAIELRAHRLLTTDAGWPLLDVPVQVIGPDSADA